LDDKPILAILAGSRKQEISKKLPIMLNAAKAFPNYQVVIAGAPSMNPEFYKQFHTDEHTVVFNETYPRLDNASLAIVTSGTATLETALFKVPEVVCYVGNPLSYLLAKKLIKVKFISLVNLILDREVVRELIQHECTSENIVSELKKLEVGAENRAKLITEYEHLTTLLGKGGASEKAANEIVKLI
jgi:lipid-A-disaccharide synthase